MTHLITPAHVLIAVLVLGAGILAGLWLTRSKPRHGVRATTSHRQPRTQTLGGTVETILRRSRERDPGPVPAAMYPPIGASDEIYRKFYRGVTPLVGVGSPMEDTSQWPAIRDEIRTAVRAGEPEPEPVATTAPEPEFAMAASAPGLELEPKAEAAMERFEQAHAAEVEAAGDTTEMDRTAYGTPGTDLS